MFSLRRLLAVTSFLALTTHAHADSALQSPFKFLAQAHLASLPPAIKEVSEKKSEKKNTQLWKNQTIQERELVELLYEAFNHSSLPISPVLNNDGLKDLELVCGNAQQTASVINTLPLTTTCGSIYAAYAVTNPTAEITELQQRQAIIKALIENSTVTHEVQQALNAVKKGEKNVGLLLAKSEANEQLAKLVLFSKYLPSINSSPLAQNITAGTNYTMVTAGHLFPLLVIVAGKEIVQRVLLQKQIAVWEKHLQEAITRNPANAHQLTELFTKQTENFKRLQQIGYKEFFGTHVKEVLGFKPVKCALAIWQAMCSYTAHSLKKSKLDPVVHLQKQLISVADSVRCLDLIVKHSDTIPAFKNMKSAALIKKYVNNSPEHANSPMVKLVNLLRKNTFNGNASHFSFQGNTRAAFALLLEARNEIHELFTIVGEIDMYMACAQLIKQSEEQAVGYSFAEYTQDATAPSISATNIWHPLVGAQKSVTNSIELGGDKPTNIIITGPNAGGKSTFLKGLTLNVLFAQSLGIVPAKKFVVTPFAKINTYMNIADDTAGGNSLFKSEVLRAQSLMNTVKALPTNQFAFSVMDEMFSGTSPKEGEAASYAVSQELGSLPNNMLLLATHFQKLTGLEENTGNFINYQVRVVQHENGTFSYPFKLELGKADQNVAIQILQQQGFSSSILDNANAILAQK